jgi:methylglyoxal reductase
MLLVRAGNSNETLFEFAGKPCYNKGGVCDIQKYGGEIVLDSIRLGKTDIMISKLGLGAWAIGGGSWWGENDDRESAATIHEAIALGINLVDTAPVYGFGHSEEVVGNAIRDRRGQVILSTKCGLNWDEKRRGSFHFSRDGYTVDRNLTAASLRQDLEDSLRRLGTDYIDLYITHWQAAPDFPTAVAETMGALAEMKRQGKIRAIGASNVNADIVREYLRHGQLDIIQERYSMLDRKTEQLFGLCKENGITIMAYSPLEQGLFTGKYPRDYRIPKDSVREARVWFRQGNLQKAWDMMEQWKPLCEKYGCTAAQLAIAWTSAQAENLQVLCGARKPAQIQDNVGGGALRLESGDLEKLRSLAEATLPEE